MAYANPSLSEANLLGHALVLSWRRKAARRSNGAKLKMFSVV